MLTLDPPPLPDESLYSLVCRAYMIDAGFTHRKTLKWVFDPMGQGSDLEMIGGRFHWFWEICLKPYWTLPKAIIETTLFRLYASALSLQNRRHIVKWVGKTPLSIRLMLEQFFYVESLDLYYLKYCPECITTDIDQYGVPYWHRSHCCKFAFACHQHSCELVSVGLVSTGNDCFLLPAFSDAGKGKACSLLIEDRIYQCLNSSVTTKITPDQYWANIAKQLEQHLGSGAPAILQENIKETFSTSDMERLAIRYEFADGTEREWVLRALQTTTKRHVSEDLLILTG